MRTNGFFLSKEAMLLFEGVNVDFFCKRKTCLKNNGNFIGRFLKEKEYGRAKNWLVIVRNFKA